MGQSLSFITTKQKRRFVPLNKRPDGRIFIERCGIDVELQMQKIANEPNNN